MSAGTSPSVYAPIFNDVSVDRGGVLRRRTREARTYVDHTVSKTFKRDSSQNEFYVNAQSLFNLAPPIEPIQSSVPGCGANGLNRSGGAFGADTVDRYYTIGFRTNLRSGTERKELCSILNALDGKGGVDSL
jgi:hypothetical protein